MNPPNLLEDLVFRFHVLTQAQMLKYFGGNKKAMLRFLRAQTSAGSIAVSTELVRMRQGAEKPIICLKSGELPPSAEQITYLARQRWSGTLTPTIVIRGTAKLAALYGGEARTVVTAHLSHDVALADVLLSKRELTPEIQWLLVHSRPGGGPLPDAIAASGFIEVIGRYNGAMVAAKMELAAEKNIEFW
jgi:hypothetical protein